ncbi:MAG TPA: MFS transporter [Pseudoflavonifractor sp.]|nr:MFS transporter [Pseudoflavonifractor sp.]
MENTTAIKRLKNPNYMCVVYGVGKLLFAMMTCCELYYFSAFLTDSALLATALVASILSITSVVDFVLSFFIGVFLETIRLPWGKYRSWLLVAPPIVTVLYMLMFTRVSDNETVAAAVIIVAFILSHLIWSIGEASINSMSLVMTDDLDERARLSVWLGRGSMGNTLIFGLVATPIMSFINGLTDGKLGFAGLALVMGFLYLVGYWWLFFATRGCEETSKDRRAAKQPKQKSNLGPAIKSAFTNRHLLVTMFCIAATYCYMIGQSGSMFYYFTYTFGGTWITYMGIFVTLISCGRLVGSIFVPALLKLCKGNKQMVYIIGFFGVALFDLLPYLLNPVPTVAMVLILIGTLFGACPLAMWLGLYQDCAVYSEYKSGKDVKGFIMSLSVMPVKLGITVKSFIISAFLLGIGYSATAADTAAYPDSFRALFLLVPTVICVAAGVLHLLIYRLPETKVAEMQAAIDQRRANA